MTQFVETNWILASCRSGHLKDPPFGKSADYPIKDRLIRFVVAHDDGREIWATETEVVELSANDNRVIRRAAFVVDEIVHDIRVYEISECRADEEGQYFILGASDVFGFSCWRFNWNPNFDVRFLGNFPGMHAWQMSTDGVWFVGLVNELLVRGRIDHRLIKGKSLLESSEQCLSECARDESIARFANCIDVTGRVFFSQFNLITQHHGVYCWESDGRAFLTPYSRKYHFVSDGAEVFGCRTYSSDLTLVRPYHSGKEKFPGKLICTDSYVAQRALLRISAEDHKDALESLLSNSGSIYSITRIYWNVARTRVSVVRATWNSGEYPKIRRAELRVIGERDSLVHRCAAFLAKTGNLDNEEQMPIELSQLISKFRNAQSMSLSRKNES